MKYVKDCLGRIIYEGDIDSNILPKRVENIVSDNWVDVRYLVDITRFFNFPAFVLEVDLKESPSHTNYERYFADLGTLDEVITAFLRSCTDDMDCHECPFSRFGEWIDRETPSCVSFEFWLYREATE